VINILDLSFKDEKHNLKELEKFKRFLKNISNKYIDLNCNNLAITIFKLFLNYPKNFFFISKTIFLKLPFNLLSQIPKTFKPKDKYFSFIQDTIIDGIERSTGDVREKKELNSFINKYIISFFLRAVNIIYLLEIISIYIKLESINIITLQQMSGFPFGGISSFCEKKGILMCTCSIQIRPFDNNSSNLNFLISRNIINDRFPFPHDLKKLSLISDSLLDKYLSRVKTDFILKRDPISNPNYIKKFYEKHNPKDLNYFKNIFKNKKKNGIVLIHLLTDCPRKRCEEIWINNYLEWLNETIRHCKNNKELNWFFKAHPFSANYPIMEKHSRNIEKNITESGFFFIKAEESFLHEDVAKLASVVVTCHGTCKLEYPALYRIPVISCYAQKELSYDPLSLPFTAKDSKEYELLIKIAHKLEVSDIDYRKAKELLVFSKLLSGQSAYKDLRLNKHIDSNKKEVMRNY